MTAVDARFAGGEILVDEESSVLDGTRMVTIDAPGWDVVLFPHEARALAAALIDAAAKAESRAERLRRRPDVDDRLRELDD